ncbi:hypothetical protein CB0940_08050 [Cercospora beticola]|uniref:Uncharacterized protein n=1 Tax=Cercospora beticola TaxID=122368 RepID=A0A2G5HQ77_CERBT|nr:hypothetical protein CB0940_08050 [Cercospora beticola]PIA94685.1 hypothetical protein CB0940_08050 [Cercospora beticola]WPB04608.1 hypothetical protein RHO25_009254 [Cercospora beticola]CAK1364354.1 unnamed protein product [Cercospora beticola]
MFKTLLLATVVGAGAANIPLEERGNSPPSYQCSSVNKKCSQAKQVSSVSAYCSSYLKVPKTATKTVTKCQTTTAYSTIYTKTVTKPATTTATTTITGCAYPSRIPAREPVEGGTRKRDAEPDLDKRYGYPVQKPSCLSSYKKSSEITSACKCLSLKPKTTQTTTVTTTKTVSKPYKTESTVYDEPSTKTVYEIPPNPTFAIARADNPYEFLQNPAGGGIDKRIESGLGSGKESGSGLPLFAAPGAITLDDAILFQLNNAGGLNGEIRIVDSGMGGSRTGQGLGVNKYPQQGQPPDNNPVNFTPVSPPASPLLTPISCSISQNAADGTCPIDCEVPELAGEDVNQQFEGSDLWFLGPAGTTSDQTYITYAVTKEPEPAEEPGNSPQEGERRQSGGGNKKRWLDGVPTGHGGNPEV